MMHNERADQLIAALRQWEHAVDTDVQRAIELAQVVVVLHELYEDGLSDQLPGELYYDDNRLTARFDHLARRWSTLSDVVAQAGLLPVLFELLWATAPSVGHPAESRERWCHRAVWQLLDVWQQAGQPTNGLFAARFATCCIVHLSPAPAWDVDVRAALDHLLAAWSMAQTPDGTWPGLTPAETEARLTALHTARHILPADTVAGVCNKAIARHCRPGEAQLPAMARTLVDELRTAAEARLVV